MKNSLVIIVLFLVLAVSGHAQNTDDKNILVSEIFDDAPLSKVLRKLRKTYDLKIAYEDNLTKGVFVNVSIENATPADAIKLILNNTDLDHLFVNDKIIIIPRKREVSKGPQPKRYDLAVSGVIRDESTGETLPNAIIRIAGTSKGAVSNVDGYFTILKVPNDTCTLQIDYLGYMSKTIRLDDGILLDGIDINLRSDVEILNDVTITDEYDAPVEVNDQISKVAFNPRALTNLPSLGEHDLFKTVQLLPGISGTNESSANLIIRGALPSQNLVLLDGFTVYHLDHFFGVFSALNTDIIKDVQIYKGGFDSKYGGRVSGVVDITGKSGNTKKTRFNLGANLMSVRASVELPVRDNLGVLISVRRAYTDIIQSRLYQKLFDIARENDEQLTRPISNERFEEIEPTFFFTDFNSKISYRPSEKDNVSLSLYAGTDNLSGQVTNSLENEQFDISFDEQLTETTEWGNIGFSLRWGRQWSDKHYMSARISSSEFFKDYSFNYNFSLDSADNVQGLDFGLRQENLVKEGSFNFDHEYLLSEDIGLEFGASFVNHNISYKTFTDDEIADESDEIGSVSSFYGTINFKLTEGLTTSIGGRANYHQGTDSIYFEPRLSFNYKVSDRINIKGAYGLYHQFVNQIVYDDPYNGNQNFWAFSTTDGVPVVASNHYIAGASYKIDDFILDVEAYYKDVSGLVEFDLAPFFISEDFLDFGLLSGGTGRQTGLDVLIQKETGKHKGWISYSLSKSEQSFQEVDRGAYYPSLQDQRHEVKFVNMLTLGKWNLSSSWIYGSGRPYPRFDVLYFTDDSGLVNDFAVVKDQRNDVRLPDYHRLDLSAAYNFTFNDLRGQFGLSIFNAYGRGNIKTRKLNISELQQTLGTTNRPEPSYRDLVLIDFTPSLFVNLSF